MTLVVNVRGGPSSAGIAPNRPPVDIPHLDFPFRFGRNVDGSVSAAMVEQDTLDEVFACVENIVACPIGFRDELPPFGVHLPEFAQVPVDGTGLQQQVSLWEPRVETFVEEFADPSSEVWRHVRLNVSTSEVDE